ncbi:MAG TPA: O-antigen ligase family protein [Nitrospiraceae bacterium]|jgi:O-antigen ligase|nr:O-antigen ligase family protein [Nitrospiraceae bacterium]
MSGGEAVGEKPARWTVRWPDLDDLIRVALYAFICSLPFTALLVVERNGFIVLLILLAWWCAGRRRVFLVRTPFDRPIAAFVLWVGLTIPFATFPVYSLKEYGKLLQQVLVFYAVLHFFREGEHRRYLLAWLLAALAPVSAYGIAEFNPTDPQAMRSFLPAEVWLTTYLVMFLPVGLALAFEARSRWLRLSGGSVAALSACCLLLTHSRAGLVALLCELWAFGWLLRRRSAWLMAGSATAAVVLALAIVLAADWAGIRSLERIRSSIPIRSTPSSVIHRFDIWVFSLQEIAEHPLVGIGYGKDNFKLVYADQPETVEPGHAPVRMHGTHNILLYLALHVGLPGLLLFLWLIGSIFRHLTAGFRSAEASVDRSVLLGASVATAGLMVRLLFDQMFVGTLAILYWVLLAAAVLHLPPRPSAT